jgi:hypothetical protein
MIIGVLTVGGVDSEGNLMSTVVSSPRASSRSRQAMAAAAVAADQRGSG